MYITSRLRDQRILDALISVARSADRPEIVRLSALRVLVSYFKPKRTETLARLQNPPLGSPLAQEFEFQAVEGSSPITDAGRQAILTLVQELKVADGNPTVRRAAQFLAEGLTIIE